VRRCRLQSHRPALPERRRNPFHRSAHPTTQRSTPSMAIQVRIPTILRTHTGGNKTVEGSGATLGALVDDLDAQHPGIKGRLVTEEGKLHRFVNVYVNDEDVRFTGALDTAVKDGDSVTILPAVAGGC
jgi:molybdopterin synthase sulfur carrier subunit